MKDECPCQLGKWELNDDLDDPLEHIREVDRMYNQRGRRIKDAKNYDFLMKDQDFVVMATDEFFDNIHDSEIEACTRNCTDPSKISSFLIKRAIKNTLRMHPLHINDITIITGIVYIDANNQHYNVACYNCTKQQEFSRRKRH